MTVPSGLLFYVDAEARFNSTQQPSEDPKVRMLGLLAWLDFQNSHGRPVVGLCTTFGLRSLDGPANRLRPRLPRRSRKWAPVPSL